jgi:7-cyano-7-deazaguanine synthase
MTTAVCILSGGMDSTVTAHIARQHHNRLWLVSFDYGQKHHKELDYAIFQSVNLRVAGHFILPLPIKELLNSSALVNEDIEVPEGHYAHESMKSTVVPNRNSIMLNIAAALAISKGAVGLYTGVHAGDHPVYPDCRPEFLNALQHTLKLANEGFIHKDFRIVAPFLYSHKSNIVQMGEKLGVKWEKTWSCYKGGRVHCGRCSTCVERKVAFLTANVIDPTEYEYGYDDQEFLNSALPDLTEQVLDTRASDYFRVPQNLRVLVAIEHN